MTPAKMTHHLRLAVYSDDNTKGDQVQRSEYYLSEPYIAAFIANTV